MQASFSTSSSLPPLPAQYHLVPGRSLSLLGLKALPYLERLPTAQGQPLMVCRCPGCRVRGGHSSAVPARLLGMWGSPHTHGPCCLFTQAYTEAGRAKLAATSRQIAFVLEPTAGEVRLSACPDANGWPPAQAHFIDAVMPPDPAWQVKEREALRAQLGA